MLKSFCCMRLNTAGVVIGWVGAVFGFIGVVLISLALGNLDDLVKILVKEKSDLNAEEVRQVFLLVLVVELTITVINLTASALLVAGTMKERHLMLMPWLINNGFALILNGIYALIVIFGTIASGGVVIFQAILIIAIVAFQFYIFAAVYSLYKQLQSNRLQDPLINVQRMAAPPSYTKI